MLKTLAIDGEREALDELRKAAAGKFRKAVESAIDDSVVIIAEEARRLVPVRTGRLKRSIKTKRRKNSLTADIYCDYPQPQDPKKTRKGKKEYYAFSVEFGSKRRNIKAQPFLFPAVGNTQKEVDERMMKVLEEAMP